MVLEQPAQERTMFTIKQVGGEAVSLLATLHHAVFVGGEVWSQAAFEQIFAMPGTQAWLACTTVQQREKGGLAEGVPVGFIITRFVLDEGEILSLGVHPAWRRRGVGRYLLQHLLQKLQQTGNTLFLEVRFSNIKAVALYKQEGFFQVAIRPNYYNDGEDARIMRYSPQ